jgi:diguanylate cyclase (GGDEF)-like protein
VDVPDVPWSAVEALLGLTERALERGLDPAIADVVRLLEAAGIDASVDPIARVVAEATASARRALATRDDDAARVDELRELARVDDLTGTLNRRAFFSRLDDELVRGRRAGNPVTLVLYDLDGFKAINDQHGHPTGDAALQAFAARLESNLRGSDSVGRIGGDEFALILIGADADDEERILARLATSLCPEGAEQTEVQASYGAARFPEDGDTREALVAIADRRLYEHKRRPRS